jgi:hypothetical protein
MTCAKVNQSNHYDFLNFIKCKNTENYKNQIVLHIQHMKNRTLFKELWKVWKSSDHNTEHFYS